MPDKFITLANLELFKENIEDEIEGHHDSTKQDKITDSVTLGSTTLDETTLNRLLALLPSLYPSKGDIISMDLDGNGAKNWRVLNINGSIASVVAMFDSTLLQSFNASSKTIVFSDGTTAQQYMGSDLDTYLNETWYNTLSADAKAAIVEVNRIQDLWGFDTSGSPAYQQHYTSGTTDLSKRNGTSPIGNRKVYALSVQDIIDYLGTQPSETITYQEVFTIFWNNTSAHSGENLWLSSASTDFSNCACNINGKYGFVGSGACDNGSRVRPALSLDLSKIDYTIID